MAICLLGKGSQALKSIKSDIAIAHSMMPKTSQFSGTVLAVWKEGGAECELWKEVPGEMCVVFSTQLSDGSISSL